MPAAVVTASWSRLRWLSVAPLGRPVVPLVNWMLIAWPGSRLGEGNWPLVRQQRIERDARGSGRTADLDHETQIGQCRIEQCATMVDPQWRA